MLATRQERKLERNQRLDQTSRSPSKTTRGLFLVTQSVFSPQPTQNEPMHFRGSGLVQPGKTSRKPQVRSISSMVFLRRVAASRTFVKKQDISHLSCQAVRETRPNKTEVLGRLSNICCREDACSRQRTVFLHSEVCTQKAFKTQSRSSYTQTVLLFFPHRSFYREKPLHSCPFTHRHVSTLKLLHTGTCTRRSFSTEKPPRSSYTQKHLHTEFSTQRSLYTEVFTHRSSFTDTLHRQVLTLRNVFAHRSFCTETSSHTEVCTQKFLQRDEFTHVYTEKLLHKEVLAQRNFYTEESLHRNAFTQK